MNCDHDAGAACWLCSDARPWWREARIAAGISAEPPNRVRRFTPAPELAPLPRCRIDGCERAALAPRDLCHQHYDTAIRELRDWKAENAARRAALGMVS